ncbi:hypothetical protein E8E13_001774 [Curvularia kusanoi]|uniref:Ubiquitin-like protease family profile domain-containing protein n=1 Tax=Curvularia kusanoi TaxID=90978 RepID=A0A9P4TBI7_CURKU|nr:hypothetical protein E8E13_001774 [Curvularia kusanoi]
MSPKSSNDAATELPPNPWAPAPGPTSQSRDVSIDLTGPGSPTGPYEGDLLPRTDVRLAPRSHDTARRKLSDAVPVPNPARGYAGPSRNMAKPGAGSAFKPTNTLDVMAGQINPSYGRTSKTTYGKRDRPPTAISQQRHGGQQAFLEKNPQYRPTSPAKRRKMGGNYKKTIPTVELVDSDDEHGPGGGPRAEQVPTSRARSAIASRSPQGSTASKHSGTAGTPASQPTSEFRNTDQLMNPRRPRSRRSRVDLKLDDQSEILFDDSTVPAGSPPHGILNMVSSNNSQEHQGTAETPKRSVHRSPPKAGRLRQSADGQTSKHFPPSQMRINESTAEENDRMARQTAVKSRADASLSTSKPAISDRSRDTDHFEGSEDELAKPNTSKMRDKRLPKEHKQSKISTAWQNAQPGDYLLNSFRTYDSGHQKSLLRPTDNPAMFRVMIRDINDNQQTRHMLNLKSVNRALTDDECRIRLTGPLKSDGSRYWFDLAFEDAAAFRHFRDEYAFPACSSQDQVLKSPGHMQNMFNVPLVKNNKIGKDTAVAETLVSSHKDNEQQALPKTPLIKSLIAKTATKTNEAASKPNGLSKPSQSLQSPLRPVRSTRTRVLASDVETHENEREVFKFSQQPGFEKPWPSQLNYGIDEGFLKRRKCTVNYDDLPKLDEEEFLNDSLVNFYLLYLYNELKVPMDRVYFFNTYFFETLTRNTKGRGAINYDAVKSWTRRDDVFSYDHIVVPINENFHWYLAIICNVSNIARRLAVEGSANQSLNLDQMTAESPIPKPATEESNDVPDAKTENETDDAVQVLETPIDPGAEPEEENLFEEERRLSLVDPEKTNSEDQPLPNVPEYYDEPTPQAVTVTAAVPTAQSGDDSIQLTPLQSKQQAKGKNKQKPAAPKRDPENPTIMVLDSLGGAHSNATKALREWLRAEGLDKRSMDAELDNKAVYAKPQHVPMQSNFSDCGLYVLGYAKKFFADPDDFKNKLLKGEMSTETDWPDMDASKMRTDIRDLVISLYKAQQHAHREASKARKALKAKSTPTPPSEPEPNTTKPTMKQPSTVETGAQKVPQTDQKSSSMTTSSTPGSPVARRLATPLASKVQVGTTPPHVVIDDQEAASEAASSKSATSKLSPVKRTRSIEVRISTSPKIDTSTYVRYDGAAEPSLQRPQKHVDRMSPSRVRSTDTTSRKTKPASPVQSHRRSGSNNDPISLDDSQDLDAPVQRQHRNIHPEIIELDRSQELITAPSKQPSRSPQAHRNTDRRATEREDSIQDGMSQDWLESRDLKRAIRASLNDAPRGPTAALDAALVADSQTAAEVIEVPETQPMEVDQDDAVVPESPEMDWEPESS